MQWCCRVCGVVMMVVVVQVLAEGENVTVSNVTEFSSTTEFQPTGLSDQGSVPEREYDPNVPKDTGSIAQFDVPVPPKETSSQAGGRDESNDPSKWIMNLVSTKLPPSKRYRRPTTVPPKALAQGATDNYDQDHLGISVSPE